MIAGKLVFCNLRQPPITRTNRQIRHEITFANPVCPFASFPLPLWVGRWASMRSCLPGSTQFSTLLSNSAFISPAFRGVAMTAPARIDTPPTIFGTGSWPSCPVRATAFKPAHSPFFQEMSFEPSVHAFLQKTVFKAATCASFQG